MENRRFTCSFAVLVLLTLSVTNIARSKPAKPTQEPTSRLFLELIRTGYDLVEDNQLFADVCLFLNKTLTKRKDSELRMAVAVSLLTRNGVISNIDWAVEYDDYIAPISARCEFVIDVSENSGIKIEGDTNSISNLQGLARDYIFYPDSISKRLAIRIENIEGIGEVETSNVVPTINLHLPKKENLSISDWKFFFDCLRELIELYDDERNKASLKLFDKDYLSLSIEEKAKMFEIIDYNMRIEIIR